MIIPKGFTVLVKARSVEETLKQNPGSKIVIPETVKDTQRLSIDEGDVVSVGNCAWKDLGDGSPWCEIGDRVLYSKFAGKYIKHQDTEYTLLLDRDIIGVIKE